MLRIHPEDLRNIANQIFTAAGFSPEDAGVVVDHLVESSLFGHDSHGVLRMYEYLDFFENGVWKTEGAPRVVADKPCTAVVDGESTMGQIGGVFAMRLAMRKAREYGVGTVALRNCGHLGRVGAYPLMAARDGMIGLALVNAGRLGRQIAPYGGIDGKMSTNPIAFAAPRRDADPIMVDMATSVTAEGKIRVARNRGESVPDGWLIDRDGKPTNDPDDYLESPLGAILPLGGVGAHKGYCMSFVVEVLGGVLSGEGVASGAVNFASNGALLTAYDIEHFTELERYFEEIETLVRHVRTSRVDPQVGEILIPGEPEFRCAEERGKNGIEIDDTTWARIRAGAEGLGIDTSSWAALAV